MSPRHIASQHGHFPEKEYGTIGMIFALMAYLTATGVVIILGAVVGLVWQEQGLSFATALCILRWAR